MDALLLLLLPLPNDTLPTSTAAGSLVPVSFSLLGSL